MAQNILHTSLLIWVVFPCESSTTSSIQLLSLIMASVSNGRVGPAPSDSIVKPVGPEVAEELQDSDVLDLTQAFFAQKERVTDASLPALLLSLKLVLLLLLQPSWTFPLLSSFPQTFFFLLH